MSLSSTLRSPFKAPIFRSSSSAQYGDIYYVHTISAIMDTTASTLESLRASYLTAPDDTAVPQVFGSVVWQKPSLTEPAQCRLNLLSQDRSSLRSALTLTPTQAIFANNVAIPSDLTIGSGDARWKLKVDRVSNNLLIQVFDRDTNTFVTQMTVSIAPADG